MKNSSGARSILSVFIFLIASSCGSGYQFRKLSEFNLRPEALKDGAPIKLIYSSQGPDDNNDLSYYIHVIAVAQESGDTVNILTTTNNGFDPNDGDRVFRYLSADNTATILSQLDDEVLQNLKHVDSLKNYKLKKPTRVARDPSFDELAINDYPTVIGSIGIMSENIEQ